MRILFLADDYPWPERTGYRIRLAQMVEALAEVGTLDVFVVVNDPRPAPLTVPAGVPVARALSVECRQAPGSRLRRVLRWSTSSLPRGLLWGDWGPARAQLRSWAADRYDLIWFSHVPVYVALRDVVRGPAVVDLDNLDAFVLRQQRVLRRRRHHPAGTGRRAAAAARLAAARPSSVVDLVDEHRTRRVTERIARTAQVVAVCSDLDRTRLGARNAVVIPNGYERPGPEEAPARQRPADGGHPVLLLVGLLSYEPNLDAATYFVGDVLPLLRAAFPAVQLRLVGRYRDDDDVRPLRKHPGVSVVGEVADVRPELALADIAVVPIRSGGGTRIKILEAFAHRLPVVSTSVGCEGLDVVPGQHLLVADTAADFAAACERLLTDPDLRARLVTAAHQLYLSRYQWATIRPGVAALARRIATS